MDSKGLEGRMTSRKALTARFGHTINSIMRNGLDADPWMRVQSPGGFQSATIVHVSSSRMVTIISSSWRISLVDLSFFVTFRSSNCVAKWIRNRTWYQSSNISSETLRSYHKAGSLIFRELNDAKSTDQRLRHLLASSLVGELPFEQAQINNLLC